MSGSDVDSGKNSKSALKVVDGDWICSNPE